MSIFIENKYWGTIFQQIPQLCLSSYLIRMIFALTYKFPAENQITFCLIFAFYNRHNSSLNYKMS